MRNYDAFHRYFLASIIYDHNITRITKARLGDNMMSAQAT